MRDDISREAGLQRPLGLLLLLQSGANILLLDVKPTGVPGFGRLSILFTSWGCVRVVCFGLATALVLGFFGFGAWLASGPSSSASPV